jgi:hypothetical protein
VITAKAGALDGPELESLKHQAQRALPRLEGDSAARNWLEALERAPAGWSLPYALADGEVLVVPRLSALARLEQFEAELKACGVNGRSGG